MAQFLPISSKDASKSFLLAEDSINYLKFIPDGKKILILSLDGNLMIFDFTTNIISIIDTEKFNIVSISCCPNGQQVSLLDDSGKFQIYNITDLKKIETYTIANYDSSFSWLKDGITYQGLSKDTHQEISKFFVKKYIAPFCGFFLDIVEFTYSPNGKQLAIANSCGNLEIWCLLTCKKLHLIKKIFLKIRFLVWSVDGNFIVIADNSSMCVLNLNTQTLGQEMKIEQNAINIKISSSSLKGMISILYEKTFPTENNIIIYDLLTGEKLYNIKHKKLITSFTWSLDGLSIVSGHTNGTLKFWNLIPKESLFTLILVNRRRILVNKSAKTITNISISTKIPRIPEELWSMITREFLL